MHGKSSCIGFCIAARFSSAGRRAANCNVSGGAGKRPVVYVTVC
ncbi:hypothetical protein SELSPUOL_01915 [Selenomonas sputigena ATCC 35185]|uniref:Uncharacterized protein n=1 Tax=Selenomonas sputigena (strain ATCC 35185 / DSM 20758 / CCUG 44933 / VPI D19B-28) TaxID=546271 RepID=C9LWR0_SELS3|nr:hypothetical protein SELSPUOL_01915 [Selenomonas sputigena ATCC 35185]